MAFIHGKGTAVLMGLYDITAYCDSFDCAQSLEPAETTVFSATAKAFIPGLRDGSVSLAGNADYAGGAIDDTLAGAISGGQQVFTAAYGGLTIGNRARVALLRETNYAQSAPVGDKVTWSADLQPDGGVDGNAVILSGANAFTTTANLASVDNSAASTNGYAANIHVTAVNTLTSIVVKVQDSTDNSSWTDLVTFATATGLTSEQKTGTGTVKRYLRVICSAMTGTSATVTVGFARR
jgi:hypothetical protein